MTHNLHCTEYAEVIPLMQSQEREPDFTLTGVDLSIDQLISRVDQEHRIILDYLDRGLTNIPARIGSLSSLQLLHLSKNKLSRLPPEFSSLRIRRLDLSNNLFDTMPPEVFSLSCLETLDLSGNNIQFIPPDISKLTTLKVLNLTSNKIAALPPELFLLPNLHTLYLGSNKISIVPSDIHLCSRAGLINV